MSFALYRKYRPASFDSVIGQNHITQTLKNQITTGRISHAYLFCGSRGVGKTTLARIFARAINCLSPNDAPCGSCSVCTNYGSESLDISEIDAASNNGVDDARELRERVKYPPLNGKYKVYIIDEVHMLSGSAFNALLKTLEEPPEHAVFILATTEPHKLPATILSRCMRFDFKLVPPAQIASLIQAVYQQEGRLFDDDAVMEIAYAAEGSVRDALSLADTCISLPCEKLSLVQVKNALGIGGAEIEELFAKICAADLKGVFKITDSLLSGGMNIQFVAKELSSYARDLMVASVAPEILPLTEQRKAALVAASKSYNISTLSALVQIFSELDSTLRYSISPKIAFEAAVFKAIKLYSLDLNALDRRILSLENALAHAPSGITTVKPDITTASTQGGNVSVQENNNSSDLGISNTALEQVSEPVGFEEAISTAGDIAADTNIDLNKASIKKPTQKRLSAQQLWGRIVTFLRLNGTASQAQAAGNHNNKKLELANDTLKIFACRESYLTFCTDEFLALLKDAAIKEGMELRFVVEKDNEDIDMQQELESFSGEFGNKLSIK